VAREVQITTIIQASTMAVATVITTATVITMTALAAEATLDHSIMRV
jgi:hypothetical protein